MKSTRLRFGTRELVFKFANPGLIDLLVCLGSVVFRILSQVGIVSNRFLNPLDKPHRPMWAVAWFATRWP